MSIRLSTMRWIDRWVGIPLCVLLTPLIKLQDKWRALRRKEIAHPQRILFIELSEMGSAVIADPALREAQARGAEVFFLIFSGNRSSLSLAHTVAEDHILTIDPGRFGTLVRDVFSVLARVRILRIDTVIDLELFSRFTALISGLSGAGRRVGFHNYRGEGLWRGDMLTRKVLYNAHQHIAKNFLALVHAAFASEEDVPFSKIAISDDAIRVRQVPVDRVAVAAVKARIEEQAAQAGIRFTWSLGRIFLLNVNASDLLPQRRWAPERFAELARTMMERWPDCLILLTGSAHESDYVENVRRMAGDSRVLNWVGQVEFSGLLALYSLADVMVTNDSGPAHFSALTPLKTVVLFGPETPELYGSLGNSLPICAGLACSPCVSANNHRNTPCKNNVCMQAIPVSSVLAGVETQVGAASLDRTCFAVGCQAERNRHHV